MMPATSDVSICNLAIASIGVSTFIDSLDEKSKEAGVCKLFYEQARDQALREFPWNWAERRVKLSLVAEFTEGDWGFAYAYPSDCLNALYIPLPGLRNPRSDQRVKFKIGWDGTQKVIYTDQEKAELVYTARIENPALFDPIFVRALAYLIGSEIAMPLSVAPAIASNALAAYQRAASSGWAASLNEGQEDDEPESNLISVRF